MVEPLQTVRAPFPAVDVPGGLAPINTPDRRVRVFVSSTLGELADERRAAKAAIARLRLTPVMFELGARPHPPRELYRAYLAQSDVFVGIYWERYGWVAPGEEVSGLEDEYLLSGDRPKLIYVKTPAPDREPRLSELLARIRADDHASYKPFTDAAELENLIADDLAVLLTERFAAAGVERAQGPADLSPSRVPVPPTSIVGREKELSALRSLLRRRDVRLVTLIGPGGIGKTRLALEVIGTLPAAELSSVWLVDLAPVTDPAAVPARIAATLGIQTQGNRPIFEVLADRIGSRSALLVLDNFEQVLPAAPRLAALLSACPGLRLLVTSRIALRLRGEHEFPLAPLATPPAGEPAEAETVRGCSAVQLFVARAQDVRPDFALTDDNAAAIGEVCRRLDGIPLAIELAAAQIRILPPAALLRRLSARLDLPAAQVDVPERQRTLRSTIDWSHSLLGPDQRALLARLSVFAGGWTLEEAEAVGVADGDLDALETLSALVTHSLVTTEERSADEPRFRMLDMVREYARERLVERAEQEATMGRLVNYLREFVEREGEGLVGTQYRAAVARVDAELDNLRAAMRWAVATDRAETVVRLAAPAFPYWWSRGLLREMLALADETAALPSAEGLPRDAAVLLLWCRGILRCTVGRLEEAGPFLRKLLPAARELGDERMIAQALASLGLAQVDSGQAGATRKLLEEAVELFRRLDDAWGLAFALIPLGQVALRQSDLATATAMHRQSLEYATRLDNDHLRALALNQLGLDSLLAGDVPTARSSYAAAAEVLIQLQDYEGLANCLDGLAGVAIGAGRPAVATRLHGAAVRARHVVGVGIWPLLRPLADRLVEMLRDALGEEDYRRERLAGAAMRPADAIRYGLDETADVAKASSGG